MYRPQFPFCPAPAGYRWEPVIYAFDTTNTPALSVLLNPGEETDNIPLLLDSDADFYWCGTRFLFSGLDVQLKDPFTAPLMDDAEVPELEADSAMPTVLEPLGCFCPKGSAILIRIAKP